MEENKNITDIIGGVNTAIDGAVKEGLKKLDDIPKGGKAALAAPTKVIDGVLLGSKVTRANTEKDKFTEVYKWSVGTRLVGSSHCSLGFI